MKLRENTAELLGYDFIIDKSFKTWLIEINCSPSMSYSTDVTKNLVPKVLEDVVKVVIDKKFYSGEDTGDFINLDI